MGMLSGHQPADPPTHDQRLNFIRVTKFEMQTNRNQEGSSGISHLVGILNHMMFGLLVIFILGNIGAMVSAEELSDSTRIILLFVTL